MGNAFQKDLILEMKGSLKRRLLGISEETEGAYSAKRQNFPAPKFCLFASGGSAAHRSLV
jgi:hypothetical protein